MLMCVAHLCFTIEYCTHFIVCCINSVDGNLGCFLCFAVKLFLLYTFSQLFLRTCVFLQGIYLGRERLSLGESACCSDC